jgi:hypothetical protein
MFTLLNKWFLGAGKIVFLWTGAAPAPVSHS